MTCPGNSSFSLYTGDYNLKKCHFYYIRIIKYEITFFSYKYFPILFLLNISKVEKTFVTTKKQRKKKETFR